MLITRAGAEGVDTINSQNLIILDHQFNDALSNQIIARAVRFKSHHGLATKERYVNVTRLFLSFETETPVIKATIDKTIDYTAFYREMRYIYIHIYIYIYIYIYGKHSITDTTYC